MDTKSHAWSTEISAVASTMLVLIVTLSCGGCKSPPRNPFLARDQREQETLQDEETPADETTAKTAQELADEVREAFRATTRDARSAAEKTLTDAAQRSRQVGASAVASAQTVAEQAGAAAQTRAIDALATWPIEQAGPLLLVAIAEGNAVARRAAARQLAERWPPAAGFPFDAAARERAVALAELRKLWIRQYGEINDAVIAAEAHAQEIIDDTQQVVSDARQVVDDARQVAHTAVDSAKQMQELVESLKQANLPEVARREAQAALARLAMDAEWEVRMRAARAMGELADPTFLPVLMNMLADEAEVQRQALASLAVVTAGSADAPRDISSQPTEEQVRRWQLWYQEHPQSHAGR